ncbi:hypothetical protein ETAA8_50770 [Anatilimnocola aggregata]|uniref:Uncharacterized protein n=1 Tax=Anatilimnocola aggregata TaxID=2528021 RepID=A0A517YIB4_9BACT|nr:hypothetical protein [Anatilimnocola aggregata]QDU29959.1 hypothetical protein ETAA8_50770 [Anatilimnocola aggregata]
MNLSPADIDRIVAEVVRRLRPLLAASPAAPVEKSNELKLNDKVVTLRTLHGRLEGISRLIVDQRAVVTPAVKDELRQRGISWERSTTNQARG